MDEIGAGQRFEESTSLPDPRFWREDVKRLVPLTGLRFEKGFKGDEQSYASTVARMVSPPKLPDNLPTLPDYFVKPPLVDDVIAKLRRSKEITRGVVVTGIGGAGKSLIASAVACDKAITRHFKDGVLWLDDNHTDDFNEQMFLGQLNVLARQFRDLVLTRRFRQGRDGLQYDDIQFEDERVARAFFPMWQKKYELQCLLVVDGVWNKVWYLFHSPTVRYTIGEMKCT